MQVIILEIFLDAPELSWLFETTSEKFANCELVFEIRVLGSHWIRRDQWLAGDSRGKVNNAFATETEPEAQVENQIRHDS